MDNKSAAVRDLEKSASDERNSEAAKELSQSFGFEDINPAEKSRRVGAVFDSVATRYDLMNDLMSMSIHRLWKNALVDWMAPRRGKAYLDLASGTGDIARLIAQRLNLDCHVVLSDINSSMLSIARDRSLDEGFWAPFSFAIFDAMRLPFPDRSFDYVTISFGMRNVTHIEQCLDEVYRVLKPGGRFLCLEFSSLTIAPLKPAYDFYSFKVLPTMGKMVANDPDSYRYLSESIRKFPDQKSFAGIISQSGFKQVRFRNLSGGIAAIHSGWRL